jgi:hypothetical protein
MLYSLKSFKNKRIGVFAGTIQFFMFPIVIATQSNMIIKNVFSPSILNFSDNQNIEIPTNILDLGPFTNLILSLCGIAIMCGCMLVCIKGIG